MKSFINIFQLIMSILAAFIYIKIFIAARSFRRVISHPDDVRSILIFHYSTLAYIIYFQCFCRSSYLFDDKYYINIIIFMSIFRENIMPILGLIHCIGLISFSRASSSPTSCIYFSKAHSRSM